MSFISGKVYNTASWTNDGFLRITREFVTEFDNNVTKEVVDHFDCDLSEFKEWLNMKNRVKAGCGTNADRIRSMTDEELAKFIDEAEPDCYMRYEDEDGYSTCKSRNCEECWLIWLKQEATNGG